MGPFARYLETVGGKHIDNRDNHADRQYPGLVGGNHIEDRFDRRVERRQVCRERTEQNDCRKDSKADRTDELRVLALVFWTGDQQHKGRQQDQQHTGSR